MSENGAVVVERALEPTDLDQQALLDLVRSSDPIAVVSIYIDTQTATAGLRSRAWPIEVENRLAELELRMTDDGAPHGLLGDRRSASRRSVAPPEHLPRRASSPRCCAGERPRPTRPSAIASHANTDRAPHANTDRTP
jgi:hypothetical protein